MHPIESHNRHRRRIGAGWQYLVFAIGDVVEKVPARPLHIALRLVASYPSLLFQPSQLTAKVKRIALLRDRARDALGSSSIDRRLFANVREEGGRLLQDRCDTVAERLIRGDAPRPLVDRYIESVIAGWEAGFCETSFNFTVNHGVDARGRVVVLDIGELAFDRHAVERLVVDRFWERAFSAREGLPAEVRPYFLHRMRTELTRARLRRCWNVSRRPRSGDRGPVRRRPAVLLQPEAQLL